MLSQEAVAKLLGLRFHHRRKPPWPGGHVSIISVICETASMFFCFGGACGRPGNLSSRPGMRSLNMDLVQWHGALLEGVFHHARALASTITHGAVTVPLSASISPKSDGSLCGSSTREQRWRPSHSMVEALLSRLWGNLLKQNACDHRLHVQYMYSNQAVPRQAHQPLDRLQKEASDHSFCYRLLVASCRSQNCCQSAARDLGCRVVAGRRPHATA